MIGLIVASKRVPSSLDFETGAEIEDLKLSWF